MSFHIVLYQPEIPPNTGNVIRLAANCGATLHLVEPLGFELDDARLKRAGLDYREWAALEVHPNLEDCLADLNGTVRAFSTRGERRFSDARFSSGDVLLFGPETRGLPDGVLRALPADAVLRLPMRPGSRSLNLSNAVAIAAYEAWRQIGYAGGQ